MLSKTATISLGRLNHCALSRTFVVSSTHNATTAVGVRPKTQAERALELAKEAELNDPKSKVLKVPPLEVPLDPLITDLPADTKTKFYPMIGNRDIVGPAEAMLSYDEEIDRPLPAVRWGANTPEIMALREKEKGSWDELTMAEKKQLYRHSFRQTIAEIDAPTGEWRELLYILLYSLGLSFFVMTWTYKTAYFEEQDSFTDEHTQRMIKRMIRENRNPMFGLASKYDYETGEWKKQ